MQIAVHALVFDEGRVLAIKPEGTNLYRLPKALLRDNETLAEAAKRALKKEAGIEAIDLHFVGIYDALDRYPIGRELAAVLLARTWRVKAEKGQDQGIRWVADFATAPWSFDHAQILVEQGIFASLSRKVGPVELESIMEKTGA